MIQPIKPGEKYVPEELSKEEKFNRDVHKCIAEINEYLTRFSERSNVDFELWGFSTAESINTAIDKFKESGWNIKGSVWYSFSWRVNINVKR